MLCNESTNKAVYPLLPITDGQRTGASLDFLDNSEACRYRIRVALLPQRLHKPLYRFLKPEG
jgi:hypothetical protein